MDDNGARPAPPVLHHVTFKTTRLQEMIDWYGVVVGMQVNFQDAVGAWMSNDAPTTVSRFSPLPGLIDDPEKRRRTGMHHSAFEFATFEALMAQLRAC